MTIIMSNIKIPINYCTKEILPYLSCFSFCEKHEQLNGRKVRAI